MRKLLTLSLVLLMLVSCGQSQKITDSDTMTLLVYMAGNNQLGAQNALNNIMAMKVSLGNSMGNCNLIAYVDRKDTIESCPVLLHIHDSQIDTLKRYPRQSSIDPSVMSDVIHDVLSDWKSEYYGLLLWSHGMGWLPTDQLHNVASNLNYAQTRSFGLEANPGGDPAYKCMEIEDLASAIPDGVFDYIAFDACYMGTVEVAYALRHKANFIISSCFEIISYGFPYELVTRDLLNGNLENVCRQFYESYMKQPGQDQIGGISLVRTSGLEGLASAFRDIVANSSEDIGKIDISDIQCFDRFYRHVFFDLENVVEKISTDDDAVKDFKAKLSECISYSASTPYAYISEGDSLRIDRYCGLSVYLPFDSYECFGLNDDYRMTEWSKATNY